MRLFIRFSIVLVLCSFTGEARAQTADETVQWLRKELVNSKVDYTIPNLWRTISTIKKIELENCTIVAESQTRVISEDRVQDYSPVGRWPLQHYTFRRSIERVRNSRPTIYLPAGYVLIEVEDEDLALRVKNAFDHLARMCGAKHDPF